MGLSGLCRPICLNAWNVYGTHFLPDILSETQVFAKNSQTSIHVMVHNLTYIMTSLFFSG